MFWCDPEGMAELNEIYGDFTGEPTDFPAIAHDKKINVTQEALGSDVNRLTTSVRGDLRGESRPARLHAGGDAAGDSRGGGLLRDLSHATSCRSADEITDEDREYIDAGDRVREGASGRISMPGCSTLCAMC